MLAPAPLAPTRTLLQPLGRPMDTPFSAREPSGQLNLPALSLCKSHAETDENKPRQRCAGSGMVQPSLNPGFPPLRRTPLRNTDGNGTTSLRISRVLRYSELDIQSWRIHRQGLMGVSCGTHHRAGAGFLTRVLAQRPHPPSFPRCKCRPCKRVPSFVCLGVVCMCELAPSEYTNAGTYMAPYREYTVVYASTNKKIYVHISALFVDQHPWWMAGRIGRNGTLRKERRVSGYKAVALCAMLRLLSLAGAADGGSTPRVSVLSVLSSKCQATEPRCWQLALRLAGGAPQSSIQPRGWVPDLMDLDVPEAPPGFSQMEHPAPPPPPSAAAGAEAELVEMLRGLYPPGGVVPRLAWEDLRSRGVRSRHLRAAGLFVASQDAKRSMALVARAQAFPYRPSLATP
jgi:hypothetical protein